MDHLRLFLALALFSSPISAQNEDFPAFSAERAGTPQVRNCLANAQTSIDEASCLDEEYNRQNTLLDLAFNEMISSASSAQKSQILRAQNAWKTFRDENCKVRMLNGGSGATQFHFSCLIRETITRRAEISELWDY
jgi:uncharacterized protein YecT (DUF1311 family)